MLDPIVRSVRVSGSCDEWYPLVRESLVAHGYEVVVDDPASLRLCGKSDRLAISVSLALSGLDTDVVVSVTSNVDEVDNSVDKGVALW